MPLPCASPGRPVRDALIALNATPGLPRAAICRLGREPELWCGEPRPEPAALAAHTGLPRAAVERALRAGRAAGATARRERERAAELGAQILVQGDPAYPATLGDLDLPPPVLYCRGTLPAGPAIAIVGSRRMDAYGAEAARFLAHELAAHGLVIVSGFAPGVDATAHRAALAAPGGRTVAILGCGLGVDYPPGHGPLGEEVSRGGALLTEFACDSEPRPWNFPVRNRLIAALSLGTLVVQATLRSGSLVTARLALDLGRDVWAVPGRIFDERSLGPNGLIRDGARAIQHPADVLDSLPEAVREALGLAAQSEALDAPGPPLPPGAAGDVARALVRGSPQAPEELAAATGLAVEAVLGHLLELELSGFARRHPGPAFSRPG